MLHLVPPIGQQSLLREDGERNRLLLAGGIKRLTRYKWLCIDAYDLLSLLLPCLRLLTRKMTSMLYWRAVMGDPQRVKRGGIYISSYVFRTKTTEEGRLFVRNFDD